MSEVDINNLDMFNDVEEVSADADISDQPAPPPSCDAAGKPIRYVERLKLADGIKFPDNHPDRPKGDALTPRGLAQKCITYFTTKGGQRKPQIVLEHELVVPATGDSAERVVRLNREYLSTMVMQSVQTSAVDSLLRCLTGSAGVGLQDGAKIQKLAEVVAAGAQTLVEIEWEGRLADGVVNKETGKKEYPIATFDKNKLGRMANFPALKKADGAVVHRTVEYDDEGRQVRVSAVVRKRLPIGGTRPATAGQQQSSAQAPAAASGTLPAW